MIEYDGAPNVRLRNSIDEFMSSSECINKSEHYDFFNKYMLKDYKHFINVRQKELNVKGFFKKMFNSSYSFDINNSNDNYGDFRNLKRVLKQSHVFFELDLFNPYEKYTFYSNIDFYCMNKSSFYILKQAWKPYIDYIHNKKMKEESTYAIKTKIDNF